MSKCHVILRLVHQTVIGVWSLLSFHAHASPVSFDDVMALSHATYETEVRYGEGQWHTLINISSHQAPPKYSVILFHGGCWSNAYDRDHLLPMAEALAAHGFEVWLPEYRRVGDVGGGWPGSLDDVINATKFVRQETEQRPLLIGHSAGGHLALRAAQTDIPIAGIVGLAPIIDLVTYGAKDGSCQSMVAPFMGDETYAPNERYRDASVSLTEIQVPVHIILGHIDSIVSKDQVAGLAKDQLTMIPQSGHFDLIHPDTLAFSRMLSILEQMSKQKGTSE